jgi:hypothetical protein
VLDELDRLLEDPPRLLRRRAGTSVVYDVERHREGETHYLFLRLYLDGERRQLRVLGVAHYHRREA